MARMRSAQRFTLEYPRIVANHRVWVSSSGIVAAAYSMGLWEEVSFRGRSRKTKWKGRKIHSPIEMQAENL